MVNPGFPKAPQIYLACLAPVVLLVIVEVQRVAPVADLNPCGVSAIVYSEEKEIPFLRDKHIAEYESKKIRKMPNMSLALRSVELHVSALKIWPQAPVLKILLLEILVSSLALNMLKSCTQR